MEPGEEARKMLTKGMKMVSKWLAATGKAARKLQEKEGKALAYDTQPQNN